MWCSHMHTCVHAYMRTCKHSCRQKYKNEDITSHSMEWLAFAICTNTYIHICIHTYVHIHIRTYVRMYACGKIACMHIYTYAHISVRTYAWTHFACIHTCVNEEVEMAKVSHDTSYGCVTSYGCTPHMVVCKSRHLIWLCVSHDTSYGCVPAHLYVWTKECVYVCMCVCMYV